MFTLEFQVRGLQRASGAPSVTEDDGPTDIDVGTEPPPLDTARLYWPLSPLFASRFIHEQHVARENTDQA